MKKIYTVFLALLMVLALSACGPADTAEESEADIEAETETSTEAVGGWELADNEAAALPEDVQAAFDKASEKFTGSELKPVAYIAEQIVSGTNYMILCKAATTTEDPVTSYQMVIVYADLEGNAEFTSVRDFDLTAYTEGEEGEILVEDLTGGWAVPEDRTSLSIPEKAAAAFENASKEFTGSELEPMALLGTQLVSGTNYAFLCADTLTTEDPVTSIQIVTVYEDLEGNAKISNICTVDPAEYNE